ncbi:hypothetical protein HPB51_014530 [Rhipicephalus microplus]|uniref:Uncharacterized protein n=1 Tax=Rhipicephalus microplus TaxID=6941 RepID=A0A9J6DMP7_RHIMP|nr:hypothetical protein HPB51_014530 [Rhipicephalus microplus]
MTAVPRRRKPELRLRRCSLGGRSGRSGVTRRGHARTHPRLRQRCDVRPRAQLQRRELVRPSPTNGQAVGQPAPPAMSARRIGVILRRAVSTLNGGQIWVPPGDLVRDLGKKRDVWSDALPSAHQTMETVPLAKDRDWDDPEGRVLSAPGQQLLPPWRPLLLTLRQPW